jgi:hypothetical protein
LTEATRIIFLSEEANHRMLKRREIENYLFDKEILKAFCAHHGRTFDESKYNAVVSDINRQDLKPIQQKIQTYCGSSGEIPTFKRELAPFIKRGTSLYAELEGCIF